MIALVFPVAFVLFGAFICVLWWLFGPERETEADQWARISQRVAERNAQRKRRSKVMDTDDLGLSDEAVAHLKETEAAYWYDEDDEMCEPMCELGRAVHAVSSMSRELEDDR